jgi:N utilization substance protein B
VDFTLGTEAGSAIISTQVMVASMTGSRHRARTAALQTLYEIDSSGHKLDDVLPRLLKGRGLSSENEIFATELVSGVLVNRKDSDKIIGKYAPSWPFEQLPLIDRNILRLAIFEILHDNRTPVKVAINEAIELAKKFGGDHSSSFVNGVLRSVSTLTDR